MNKITILLIIALIAIVYFAFDKLISDEVYNDIDLGSPIEFSVIKPPLIENKNEELFESSTNITNDDFKIEKTQLALRENKSSRQKLIDLTLSRDKLRYVKMGELMEQMQANNEFPTGSTDEMKRLMHNFKVTQEIAKLSTELFDGKVQDYKTSGKNIEIIMELQKKLIVPTYTKKNDKF